MSENSRVCIVQSNWIFSSVVLLRITRPCAIKMSERNFIRSMGICYGPEFSHPTEHKICSHLRVFISHFVESENSMHNLSHTHGWCPWLYSSERHAIMCLQVSQWRIRWTSSSTALGQSRRPQWFVKKKTLVCVCNLLSIYSTRLTVFTYLFFAYFLL